MSRMRIMSVIARMNVGGPAELVATLAHGLPSDRFDHTLVTGWCADDEEDYLETRAPELPAIRVSGLGRAVRPGDDVRALRALTGLVRAHRPHIVHTHTAKAGVLGRIATRAAGTGSASVHTFHGHLLSGYFGAGTTRAVVEVERTLARTTDRLVAVGPQVRDDLLAARVGRRDQWTVIEPGLTPLPAPDRLSARAELGLDPGVPVLAFVGRLTTIKRPDRLADVVELLRRETPDVVVLVAGDGDLGPALRTRAVAERLPIRLLGWRDDIGRIMSAADGVILTSDNEGTPLTLVHAALLGRPVVATDVGAVSSVVVDGVTGWLTTPEPAALAAAALELLASPGEAGRRGSAASHRARELFAAERYVKAHEQLYDEIAASHRR